MLWGWIRGLAAGLRRARALVGSELDGPEWKKGMYVNLRPGDGRRS